MNSKHINQACLIILCMSLQGCFLSKLFNPIGEDKYDCNRKENPNSPYCHSFRSVDNGTQGPVPDSRYDKDLNINDHDKLIGISPVNAQTTNKSGSVNNQIKQPVDVNTLPKDKYLLPGINDADTLPNGTPVRVAPYVQRTWIKRHTESNGAYIGNTVVYKEIVPSHWQGEKASGIPASSKSSTATLKKPHKPVEAVQQPLTTTDITSGQQSQNQEFIQPGTQGMNGPGSSLPVNSVNLPN